MYCNYITFVLDSVFHMPSKKMIQLRDELLVYEERQEESDIAGENTSISDIEIIQIKKSSQSFEIRKLVNELEQ